ncbi:MAG: hypothetical protein AAFV47_00570 [Pseudomonadota bacterium]
MTDPAAQKQIRRNALLLGVVAFAVFVAFITITFVRGGAAG